MLPYCRRRDQSLFSQMTLCFIRCLANHRVHGVHGSLQFLPKRFVYHLLSLNRSLALEFIRHYHHGNVRSIRIVICTSNFDLVRRHGIFDFLLANIHNRRVWFAAAHSRNKIRQPGGRPSRGQGKSSCGGREHCDRKQ